MSALLEDEIHPRSAARFPLKGATLADRQSRIRGVPDLAISVSCNVGGAQHNGSLLWRGYTRVYAQVRGNVASFTRLQRLGISLNALDNQYVPFE
jgi:hypothetical protein